MNAAPIAGAILLSAQVVLVASSLAQGSPNAATVVPLRRRQVHYVRSVVAILSSAKPGRRGVSSMVATTILLVILLSGNARSLIPAPIAADLWLCHGLGRTRSAIIKLSLCNVLLKRNPSKTGQPPGVRYVRRPQQARRLRQQHPKLRGAAQRRPGKQQLRKR